MDKVARRTRKAVFRADRREQRQKGIRNRDLAWQSRYQRMELEQSFLQMRKDERLRRREDWELGPLAPRRDVGQLADRYGTAPSNVLAREVAVDYKDQKWIPFRVGDRVVVIRGSDKGKIGEVTMVHEKGQRVTVGGANLWEMWMPEWMRKAENNTAPTRTYTGAIPVADVRLVVPLINPETGEAKDTIIEGIERRFLDGRPEGKDKASNYHRGEKREDIRVVPGLGDLEIPWPEVNKEQFDDQDADTLRITVEERTWIPTLLSPPFPEGVIDELRNKYSVFRSRHDDEYIERKEEEARVAREKEESIDTMTTPLKELQKQLRKDAKKRHTPTAREERGELVGDDLLSRIGELMLERKSPAKDR